MKFKTFGNVALPATLLLLVSAALAAGGQPAAPAPAGRATAASAPAASGAKARPAAKLVDINSASRAELMKLPGVSADHAQRIIAGRPYLSKAHLVTRGAIPEGLYHSIKGLIVAKQKGVPGPAPARGK